jgi:SAM-dependent methyltransferase
LGGFNDFNGKKVLEVGSGRGGGLSFLTRYFKPKDALGVDFSPVQVDACRKFHSDVPNITFEQGDAENLLEVPGISEKLFDFIINVESSHCYGKIEVINLNN